MNGHLRSWCIRTPVLEIGGVVFCSCTNVAIFHYQQAPTATQRKRLVHTPCTTALFRNTTCTVEVAGRLPDDTVLHRSPCLRTSGVFFCHRRRSAAEATKDQPANSQRPAMNANDQKYPASVNSWVCMCHLVRFHGLMLYVVPLLTAAGVCAIILVGVYVLCTSGDAG